MENSFILNKTYKCTSITGIAPSFEEVDNPVKTASLWGLPNQTIYIIDSGKKYEYVEKVVTFSVDAEYSVKCCDPLILEGKVNIPAIQPDKKILDASYWITEIMEKHCLHQPKSVVHVIIEILNTEIMNQWDGTKEGMYTILSDHIAAYVDAYSKPWRSSFDAERDFILAIFFPSYYTMIRTADKLQLPGKPSIEWPIAKSPVLKVGTKLFSEWFTPIVSPIKQ